MNLKNKKILITAGPTWVPIDKVRVISNIATGETGILLAERLQRLGVKVTLLLGPVAACCLNKKIKLIRFKFFDELKDLIKRELSLRKYDVVIHSAAVSDYRMAKNYPHKVKSGNKRWALNLVPTQKLIDIIKKNIDSSSFLVGFKFETGAQKNKLISQARKLINTGSADLVVANSLNGGRYSAYLVNKKSVSSAISSKSELVKKLVNVIGC
jgi:phosphopantothenoylcysteine decarboxylase/phosphopantothenate--cysteine ligase